MTGAPPTPNAQQIDALVARILARPEFDGLEPSWSERLMHTAGNAAGRWAESAELFYRGARASIAGLLAGQPTWAIGVAAIAAALLATGLLVYGAIRLRRKWVGDARLPAHAAKLKESRRNLAAELSPRSLRRRATRAANTGNAREAVRILYEAAVDHLASEGVVKMAPHATSEDYLREARALSPTKRASFGKVVSLYERVWYGRQFATTADIDYGIRCVASLLE